MTCILICYKDIPFAIIGNIHHRKSPVAATTAYPNPKRIIRVIEMADVGYEKVAAHSCMPTVMPLVKLEATLEHVIREV